jgi:hypothetical protein
MEGASQEPVCGEEEEKLCVEGLCSLIDELTEFAPVVGRWQAHVAMHRKFLNGLESDMWHYKDAANKWEARAYLLIKEMEDSAQWVKDVVERTEGLLRRLESRQNPCSTGG